MNLTNRKLTLEWTPARAGVVIGIAVLISYFYYDPMGMCVGCFMGHTLSWVEHNFLENVIFFPRVPAVFQTPVLGMFIGAFVAAILSREFWIRKVKGRTALVSFFSGILIGFGNFLAGGCPVRHMIVGSMGLVLESLVTFIGVVLGIYAGTQVLKRSAWIGGS